MKETVCHSSLSAAHFVLQPNAIALQHRRSQLLVLERSARRSFSSGASASFTIPTLESVDPNFLFQNAGNPTNEATEKALIQDYNSKLTMKVAAFKANHSGVRLFASFSNPNKRLS